MKICIDLYVHIHSFMHIYIYIHIPEIDITKVCDWDRHFKFGSQGPAASLPQKSKGAQQLREESPRTGALGFRV